MTEYKELEEDVIDVEIYEGPPDEGLRSEDGVEGDDDA